MFENYLITALRNIARNKTYSAINIGGLAIGLAACILISLYVSDEINYDRWIPGVENLYAVETTFVTHGRAPKEYAGSPGLLSAAIVDKIPEVIASTRLFRNNGTFTYQDKMFRERIREVDQSFLELFDLPMISGSSEQVLSNNHSMIISEDIARKYFAEEDPVGKTLTMDGEREMRITGVFRNLPENTHFELEMVALLDPERYRDRPWVAESWNSASVITYVKLRDSASAERVENLLPSFIDENAVIEGSGPDTKISDVLKFNLMPVSKIHLYADKPFQMKSPGDIKAVYTFSVVALLILVIASINFINLATARSLNRAKEVSIRKVLGSSRRQLIFQFLGESVAVTLLGLAVALVLIEVSLGPFNSFIGKELSLNLLGDPLRALGILGLALLIGLIGGLYPAFFISRFSSRTILRSTPLSHAGGGKLRQFLVIFQFSISIALIIATAVVYGQDFYARNMDKGYEIGNKINVYAFDKRVTPIFSTIVREFKDHPGVIGLAMASDGLPQFGDYSVAVVVPGFNEGQPLNIERMVVGPNFHDLYDIDIIAGRGFDEGMRADFPHGPEDETLPLDRSIIVNETFMSVAGFDSPEDAVGTIVKVTDDRPSNAKIVGVIKDLHSRSLRSIVTPSLYYVEDLRGGVITMELDPERVTATMEGLEEIWKRHMPEVVFSSSFVDADFDALYRDEQQRGQMFTTFTMLAIIISCLGLYALASFEAERRFREIGLRKVLGADVLDIVRLLVWQFSKPVIIANLIAWPVAWFIMQNWLEGFHYRIELNPLIFLGAGLTALLISWMTVGGRAIKVANASPVKALRCE